MKSFLALLLLVFVFKPVLPILGFALHYDYIKNELCVNRDRPEMHCNGSCFLKKELAKTAEENNAISTLTKSISFPFQWLQLPLKSEVIFALTPSPTSNTKTSSYYQSLYQFDLISLLFRPPVFI